jgi:hypothetical protein
MLPSDLTDQHSWRAAACDRVEALFPANKGLRPIALLMANGRALGLLVFRGLSVLSRDPRGRGVFWARAEASGTAVNCPCHALAGPDRRN